MRGSLASAAPVAAVLGVIALTSTDAARASTHSLDLRTDAATVFSAGPRAHSLGSSVAAAGDVNGDGTPDILIGAPHSDHNGRRDSGSAYVVFGASPLKPRLPLDPPGEGGFRIDGAPPQLKVQSHDVFGDGRGPLTDTAGDAVAGLGDVNGDGLADIAVSAPDASPHRRAAAGVVYVVFGKRSSGSVDLAHLGAGGYRITGARKAQEVGFATVPAGDFNGDGRGDVLVGGFYSSLHGHVYVVFGRGENGDVDLAHLGGDGIAIRGPWTLGPSIAPLGDVNGDGRSDVIVGATPTTKGGNGRAYAIFGRAAPGGMKLGSLGGAGYSIRDSGNTDFGGNLGGIVGGPGDVNGDGRPDVLVGGGDVTHVLFSSATPGPVDLAHAADRSIRIRGLDLGVGGSGSGDANGDGLADVLLGDPYRNPRSRRGAGSATVVYGRSQAGTAQLSNLGDRGYRIDGAAPSSTAGTALGWAGDLDGDGRSDVVLGAPGAGRAYLVTGR